MRISDKKVGPRRLIVGAVAAAVIGASLLAGTALSTATQQPFLSGAPAATIATEKDLPARSAAVVIEHDLPSRSGIIATEKDLPGRTSSIGTELNLPSRFGTIGTEKNLPT